MGTDTEHHVDDIGESFVGLQVSYSDTGLETISIVNWDPPSIRQSDIRCQNVLKYIHVQVHVLLA
jgi:hypothetical protein